jgi:hypothetical protein
VSVHSGMPKMFSVLGHITLVYSRTYFNGTEYEFLPVYLWNHGLPTCALKFFLHEDRNVTMCLTGNTLHLRFRAQPVNAMQDLSFSRQ